jgi:hypothetical protein
LRLSGEEMQALDALGVGEKSARYCWDPSKIV